MKELLSIYSRARWSQFDLSKKSDATLSYEGVPEGGVSFEIASLYRHLFTSADSKKKSTSTNLVVVAPSALEAEALALELELYLDRSDFQFLPESDAVPYDWSKRDSSIAGSRIRAMLSMTEAVPLLITSAGALIRKVIDPSNWLSKGIRLKTGQTVELHEISDRLYASGYRRVDYVDLPGDYCLKGSLLDVYPVNLEKPVRLDFFDIEIDSIRNYDPETQRSTGNLDEVFILPASEIVLDTSQAEELTRKLREETKGTDLKLPVWCDLKEMHPLTARDDAGVDVLFPLVAGTVSPLELYPGSANPLMILIEPDSIERETARIIREWDVVYERDHDSRYCLSPDSILDLSPDLFQHADIEIRTGRNIDNTTGTESGLIQRARNFMGRMAEVRQVVRECLERNESVVLTSPYSAQIQRMAGIFRGEKLPVRMVEDSAGAKGPPEIKKGEILVLQNHRSAGLELPSFGFYLWTDSDLFGRKYRKRARFKSRSSAPIESFLDLKEGDYVVHINHGIGKFVQLERTETGGRSRDYLILEYADSDRLFVPLDQISMVQKYAAPTDTPKLDHLGKASFKRVRERVEERIEEFAEELIKIYAARMSQQGYAYGPDTQWQEEFEAEFPYEETPDQLLAIQAVKEDMQSPRPMDRLICGDVGYGKTEIAIRAVFKAVMGGKQALVICPTTILALQHFKNFKERFEDFPVKVDWISRFRTRKEVNEVKQALADGETDVVIGTHALLAKDVKPRNLGLLVVDEEQRFGVNHKEAIKKLRTMVDVITLSATPIPRTLHLSLTGIRDLSIIQTPPKDRRPVQTYVMEDSDGVLIEAVTRELERGGQVFYLHNRVQSLDEVAVRIEQLLPDVRFTMLHGQMPEEDIEDILMDFMNQRYDLLITTAIIENGIDMPNVNTLIVDRADAFGLSQLYQIRGRVGRSNKQAYAYFFHPGAKVLTEQAQKRLSTLLEYQELGSGFKVAMRDLEIRGAGNLLGKEQSGDIMDVGYELYIKLLDDAVKRLKGEELEIEVRCAVNLKSDFYLPDDYISDTRQKIEFYKRFESARTEEEVDKVAAEMKDRFGSAPQTAQIFILVEKIRTLSSLAGFESVFEEQKGTIQLKAGRYFRLPPEHMIQVLKKPGGFFVRPGKTDTLYLEVKQKSDENKMETLLAALRTLVAPLTEEISTQQAPAAPPKKKPKKAAKR